MTQTACEDTYAVYKRIRASRHHSILSSALTTYWCLVSLRVTRSSSPSLSHNLPGRCVEYIRGTSSMSFCGRAPACLRTSQAAARKHLPINPTQCTSGLQLKRQAVAAPQHHTRHTVCSAFKEPREELTAEQVEEWERCAATLVGLGVEEEEAEKILKESYGWCVHCFHMILIW